MTERVRRAASRAVPPGIVVGAGILLFGAIDVLRRGGLPAVVAVIGLGFGAVVFMTYFILGVTRHRVASDGTVRVPWIHAWLIVLAAVLVVGLAAYLVLRRLPEPWR